MVDPDPPGKSIVARGYFMGTLFAHVTFSAAWAALGPSRLELRVDLALAWVLESLGLVAGNITLHGASCHAFCLRVARASAIMTLLCQNLLQGVSHGWQLSLCSWGPK